MGRAHNWYRNYVIFPNLESKAFIIYFCMRFRLPYQSYLSLLQIVSSSDYFSQWNDGSDTPNKVCWSPTSLIFLGCLRYLGCGWTFDHLVEATEISEPVRRAFFTSLSYLERRCYIPNMLSFPHPVKKHHLIHMNLIWQVCMEQ